jgi:hypothetical protein
MSCPLATALRRRQTTLSTWVVVCATALPWKLSSLDIAWVMSAVGKAYLPLVPTPCYI